MQDPYKVREVEFLGCKIDLSLKPFIPRPETEEMTLCAIQEIKEDIAKKKLNKVFCLDLFAGSGCIGIAILKHIKEAFVDFGEVESRFLKQIVINLKLNQVPEERYGILKTNLFSKVSFKYHYILANPPYVALKRIKEVQPEVLFFEPQIALFGGEDGLRYIKAFLFSAKNFLLKEGKIFLEIDPLLKDEILNIIQKVGYSSFEIYKDSNLKERWLKIKV